MKPYFLILLIILGCAIVSPASAAINITLTNVGYNFLQWSWEPGMNITNASVDGVLIEHFDPMATSYILSGVGPGEIHQLNLYSDADNGTLISQTDYTGQTPVGLWIFAICGVAFLIFARYAQVVFINLICSIFGLLGVQQLAVLKDIMDPSIWLICLIIYMILIISGGAAWYFGRDNSTRRRR
jgi:hypothetical protein